MKVTWLNCRLTFRPETPEEREALNAIWAAFGSQLEDGYNPTPRPDEWELE